MTGSFINTAFLLTGGNTGNRLQHLITAKQYIGEYCGLVADASSVYETAAWGLTDQPAFYNQALQLHTNMQADELMVMLLHIENKMGRVRTVKMGPRVIDIDILFFNDDIIKTETLIIPHPWLHKRRFALMPMTEIAPQFIHPVFKKNIQELLAICDDELPVHKITGMA